MYPHEIVTIEVNGILIELVREGGECADVEVSFNKSYIGELSPTVPQERAAINAFGFSKPVRTINRRVDAEVSYSLLP